MTGNSTRTAAVTQVNGPREVTGKVTRSAAVTQVNGPLSEVTGKAKREVTEKATSSSSDSHLEN